MHLLYFLDAVDGSEKNDYYGHIIDCTVVSSHRPTLCLPDARWSSHALPAGGVSSTYHCGKGRTFDLAQLACKVNRNIKQHKSISTLHVGRKDDHTRH